MAYQQNMVIVGGMIQAPIALKTSQRGNAYCKFDLVQLSNVSKQTIPVTFLDAEKAQELSRIPVGMEITVVGTIKTDTKQSPSGNAYTVISIMGKGFYKDTKKASQGNSWGIPQPPPQQDGDIPVAF